MEQGMRSPLGRGFKGFMQTVDPTKFLAFAFFKATEAHNRAALAKALEDFELGRDLTEATTDVSPAGLPPGFEESGANLGNVASGLGLGGPVAPTPSTQAPSGMEGITGLGADTGISVGPPGPGSMDVGDIGGVPSTSSDPGVASATSTATSEGGGPGGGEGTSPGAGGTDGGIGGDAGTGPAPFHQGGYVQGPNPNVRGEDVPATLQEGEYVMPRGGFRGMPGNAGMGKVREIIIRFATGEGGGGR